jgi:hypothetical protein
MARGSFDIKTDKYIKPIRCRHLPDSLESLQTFRRLVEELTRYLVPGFFENVRGNYEGNYNGFPFTHEARRKNTEGPGVSWWIVRQVSNFSDYLKGITMNDILTPTWNSEKHKVRDVRQCH